MLDMNLFREEKGHNPEFIRESQRRRFANVDMVDILLDKEWRQRQYELDNLRRDFNKINKQVVELKTKKKKKALEDATEMINNGNQIKRSIGENEAQVQDAALGLNQKLEQVGNLVHDSVPVSHDELRSLLKFHSSFPLSFY
ncbi:serine--tRNA ligase, cytoplasmic-like [Ricinus communis]|uniref:serine--tRNA ligase, cytoplasmic-like n=1 Tax=Ricinus communis TaxID=3988 RepID=UPI00201A3F0D|nr:serine--tRNA ligase, cytoplasmic-like [Ricinus communis]